MRRQITSRNAPNSPARDALAAQMRAVARAQADYDDAVFQWRRIQYIKQDQDRRQAILDAIRRKDADDMARDLAEPIGLYTPASHQKIGEAEWELNRAKRDADVARACEPEVDARQARLSLALDNEQARTLPLAAEVLVEEAAAIAAEITEKTAWLRAMHARLDGLRTFLADEKLYQLISAVARPVHPDAIVPENSEINREKAAWSDYATRLRADANATVKE